VRLRLIAVVMLSRTLALAACGGGSKAPSGPSKASFVAKADAICRSSEVQIARYAKVVAAAAPKVLSGDTGVISGITKTLRLLHTDAAAGLTKLRALSQPVGDHAKIAKFTTPLAAIVDSIGTAATGLAHGEGVGALAALQADQTAAQEVTSAAKSYGLRACETLFSVLG
jgi:hypothetical protein